MTQTTALALTASITPPPASEDSPAQSYRATYSPDDNKLRLYAALRLDDETYQKIHAVGFRWAPKQELFVVPAWTPAREDVLLSLAGDIEDDDNTLFDRQEQRADRFSGYSEKRAGEPLYNVMYEIRFIVRETPAYVREAERWLVPNKLTDRSRG
ncbi:TPA: plasmid SOS inhibition protein A [Salmonella enterica]|uniref:Plasmid SOS inhibition protein A n=1 Tax=Salmonella enterica TaxID=28901 RepID=A0A757C8C3_SALER|nr:plasmid SOS inhibition protein A [Salmonella enterica]